MDVAHRIFAFGYTEKIFALNIHTKLVSFFKLF